MPKHLRLHDCLKICCHYELLQYHLNVVKPTDKPVESITKRHFNRGGRQPSAGAKKSGTFRSQPSTKPVNSANNTVQCSNCSTTHLKNQCPAYQVTCFKCNRIGHYASECRSAIAVPILPKIQGNLPGVVVEAEHPVEEDLLQEDKSMKQQRSLKPSLMRNLI